MPQDMNRDEALQRLREITDGIDVCQGDDGAYGQRGWWETSVGGEFGAERFRLLEELIRDLTK